MQVKGLQKVLSLQATGTPVYRDTVHTTTKAARRARGKVAKQSRKANR